MCEPEASSQLVVLKGLSPHGVEVNILIVSFAVTEHTGVIFCIFLCVYSILDKLDVFGLLELCPAKARLQGNE